MAQATGSEATGEPVLLAAEPQLFVADMDQAYAFYVGTLGFRLASPGAHALTSPSTSLKK